MKRCFALVGFFLLALFITNPALQAGDNALVGEWQGALEVQTQKLRLIIKVSETEDGGMKAVMISVDQGGGEIPCDSIAQEGKTVTFAIAQIAGSYEGTINAAGNEITGTWSQMGQSLPLNLTKAES